MDRIQGKGRGKREGHFEKHDFLEMIILNIKMQKERRVNRKMV